MMASHVLPSSKSPSLDMQKMRCFAPRCLAAIAMPQATGRPWPRLPVENSTPGMWCEMWPLSLPSSQ